ncbi:MAG: sugar phosphate isomerase/epimerase [Thermoguttaceae bacterium]|nr:sugar phosphate isomerase/epimerase [Thermoguttaceae bacterium]MDW8038573.1 sugar phosphate isomerase/epimerase [Thermoguttaceae bacterium]
MESKVRLCEYNRRSFLKACSGLGLASGGGLAWAGAVAWAGESAPASEGSSAHKGPSKVKFHLGMASYTLRKFPTEQAIAMTKRLGLEWICFKSFHLPLDASAEQIAATVEKVKQAGLRLYSGGVISMSKPQEVQQAFSYAKAAGMQIIIGSPNPELLPLVEEQVKKTGVGLAIHNHGPGDRWWPLPQTAYEKIKQLDRRIGLCIDIGHTVRHGADLVKTVEQTADRILDVHVKDVTEASAKGHSCPAGRGVIDLPAFFAKLIEIGYSGVCALEYEAEENDPLPGSAESIGYFRGILAVLGR